MWILQFAAVIHRFFQRHIKVCNIVHMKQWGYADDPLLSELSIHDDGLVRTIPLWHTWSLYLV